MEDLRIYDYPTAIALLTYGIQLYGVKNDSGGKIYYSFENSSNAQNTLLLHNRQKKFLEEETIKYKSIAGRAIQADKTKFGGLKKAYKESISKPKGVPQLSNGVWKG